VVFQQEHKNLSKMLFCFRFSTQKIEHKIKNTAKPPFLTQVLKPFFHRKYLVFCSKQGNKLSKCGMLYRVEFVLKFPIDWHSNLKT